MARRSVKFRKPGAHSRKVGAFKSRQARRRKR